MGNLSPIAHASGGVATSASPGDLAKQGAGIFTFTADSGATLTNSDVAGGGVTITNDATDNDVSVASGPGTANPATVGSRFGFSAQFQTTTDAGNANWFIGFSDITDTTFFVDDTNALATMDAIGIYKVAASAYFRTCAVNATVQSGETTATDYLVNTVYNIRAEGEVGTVGYTVRFYVDNVLVDTVTNITTTGMTTMTPVIVASNGAAEACVIQVRSFVPYGNQ